MISKEVLMESLRQRETELHELQDEVERLRKGIMFFLDIDKQPSRAELLEMIK